MQNCKEEFVRHTKGMSIKCALITKGEKCFQDDDEPEVFFLKVGYSEYDYMAFLRKLNFIYDAGFGCQEIFGNIWYNDGTWSERGKYDGSEWWEHKTAPEIPTTLIAVT